VVPSDELPAQRQAEIEERERVNAALLLEDQIDKRIMESIVKNEESFARYIAYLFGRHLIHDPVFADAVMQVVKKHAATKE